MNKSRIYLRTGPIEYFDVDEDASEVAAIFCLKSPLVHLHSNEFDVYIVSDNIVSITPLVPLVKNEFKKN